MNHTSYVYIMQTRDYLKIGVTSNSIHKRVSSVQTGCPQIIEDVNYFTFDNRSDAFNAEKLLHESFTEHRTVGEWFNRFKRYCIKSEKILSKESKKIIVSEYSLNIQDINIRNKRKIKKLKEIAINDGVIPKPVVREGFEKKLRKLYKNHPNLGIWETS